MNILNDSKNELERRQMVSPSSEGDNENENIHFDGSKVGNLLAATHNHIVLRDPHIQ